MRSPERPPSRGPERTFRRCAAVVVIAAWTVALPSPAQALSCTISANPIAFGNYNGITKAQVNTTTTFTLTCTGPGTVNYVISLSPGQSGSAAGRWMNSGSNRLNYQVYKDSARTQIFGDGSGGSSTISGSATLNNSTPTSGSGTLYPAIASGQAAVPGSYGDTLTLQVTY